MATSCPSARLTRLVYISKGVLPGWFLTMTGPREQGAKKLVMAWQWARTSTAQLVLLARINTGEATAVAGPLLVVIKPSLLVRMLLVVLR